MFFLFLHIISDALNDGEIRPPCGALNPCAFKTFTGLLQLMAQLMSGNVN